MHVGNFDTGKTIRIPFNTNGAAGGSITRGTNGTLKVYKNGGTTESSAGVTDTEDFDGAAGAHVCIIDTSVDGTFYSAGADFMVMLQGAVVDGQTVNFWIGSFSIRNRYQDKDGYILANDSLTSAKIDASFTTEIQTGLATSAQAASMETDINALEVEVDTLLARSLKLDSLVELDGAVYRFTLNALEMSPLGDFPSVDELADAVWNELRSGHTTAGSFGEGVASVQGSVTGTVNSVATRVTANADQINGVDATTRLDARIDARLAAYDPPTFAELDSRTDAIAAQIVALDTLIDTVITNIAALNDVSSAEVAAAVRDLQVLESNPGVLTRPTVGQALLYLYRKSRNSAIVGTTETVRKEDGSAYVTNTLDDPADPAAISPAT